MRPLILEEHSFSEGVATFIFWGGLPAGDGMARVFRVSSRGGAAGSQAGVGRFRRAGSAVGRVTAAGWKSSRSAAVRGTGRLVRGFPTITREAWKRSGRAIAISLMAGIAGVGSMKGMTAQEKAQVKNANLLIHEMSDATHKAIQNEIPKAVLERIKGAYSPEEKIAIIQNELPIETIQNLNRIVAKEMEENPEIRTKVPRARALFVIGAFCGLLGGVYIGAALSRKLSEKK